MQVMEFPYGRDIPLTGGQAVGLFDSAGLRVANPTLQSAVRAARVLTDAAIGDGDTITIHRLDTSTQIYTWKTTLTPTIGEVLIGASNTTALTNMGSAISGGGTSGTDYAEGTEPCLDYEVASDATTLTLTAINYGDAYNTAVGNFAETGGSASWAAATSGVDTPDFKEALDYGTQANSSAAPVARNGIFPVCPTAAMLTTHRNHIEFDDDSATDFVRIDFTLLTTDHPAAGKPNGALYAGVLDDATDLAADGLTVEIPNSTHGSFGDWLGGAFSPPDTDNIISSNWMVLFNPYSEDRAVAEIKLYDFDGGGGANQGLITTVVGGGFRIPTVLRDASVLWYLIYESNVGLAAELGTQAKADVNAEVSDVFKVDTVTLPGQGAPPLTPTMEGIFGWLYKTFRNRKSQTATDWSLFADDESTVDSKATVSDNGTTAIKQEIVSGP